MKEKIIELLNQGFNKIQVAEKLSIGYSTVRKYSEGINTRKGQYYGTRKYKKHQCIVCGIEGSKNFYHTPRHYCKKCHNKRMAQLTRDNLNRYLESRGGAKCQRCGYNKCKSAICFHHTDPKQKDPKWRKNWSYKRLKVELDKCEVLCHNCHMEIHESWNWVH